MGPLYVWALWAPCLYRGPLAAGAPWLHGPFAWGHFLRALDSISPYLGALKRFSLIGALLPVGAHNNINISGGGDTAHPWLRHCSTAFRRRIFVENSILPLVHGPLFIFSSEEIFLQDFTRKFWRNLSLTLYIVISLVGSKFLPHNSVSSVVKVFIINVLWLVIQN